MKKILALMLTLVMCLSLCACGGNSEKESMEATQNAQELEIPVSQFIAERINQTLNSKAFADWQQRYEDFTGKRPNNNPYVENAIRKIASYEQNGIFPGENLILTYETKKNPLNQKVIKMMIQRYLK